MQKLSMFREQFRNSYFLNVNADALGGGQAVLKELL
jgi:hypothetical protein